MIPRTRHPLLVATLVTCTAMWAGCNRDAGKTADPQAVAAPAVAVTPVAVSEEPIARFVRVTGTLMAEEQASVAAETPGRVEATPVERGSAVSQGTELIRISATETQAQVHEAEANAAQIEARLGLATGATTLDVAAVPEVQTAKANYDLAQAEYTRIKSLLDQRVVSQSEFDQRVAQLEATRRQYEAARNASSQQFQSLLAARARVDLARKALADTVVRAPFSGLVVQRLVSAGDYVTKGMKVAEVVRINPLRVLLTIPEQFVSAVAAGQTVTFTVDAYPDRRFEGTVRFVSPSLQADQRALTAEASVANPAGDLKPGFFATARLEQPKKTPALLVPASAIVTTAGTSRAYVVTGDHVEERIVTTGQPVDTRIEVTNGLKAGERVATTHVSQLTDGTKIQG